jgi:hypothetical protein
MQGYSLSESFRFVDEDGDARTEGMGTLVSTGTTVNSHRNVSLDSTAFDCYGCRHFRSYAWGNVHGGFGAGGVAATRTVQLSESGMASAEANGTYFGGGRLGCNYNGNATGHSMTSITKIEGMRGSISSSSAGMTVTSTTNLN